MGQGLFKTRKKQKKRKRRTWFKCCREVEEFKRRKDQASRTLVLGVDGDGVKLDPLSKRDLDHELLVRVALQMALAINHIPRGVLAVLVQAVQLLLFNEL